MVQGVFPLNIQEFNESSYQTIYMLMYFWAVLEFIGGARGVMVIVVAYGHGDTSSNPGQDWLHFS